MLSAEELMLLNCGVGEAALLSLSIDGAIPGEMPAGGDRCLSDIANLGPNLPVSQAVTGRSGGGG